MDESIVKHLDAPPKVLKLSEAIRIGAKIRPQCVGKLFLSGASCALGAAWEGLGNKPVPDDFGRSLAYHALRTFFGEATCRWVTEQNDKKGLTREAIADRLEAMGY